MRNHILTGIGTKERREIDLDVPILAGREVCSIYDKEDNTAGLKKTSLSKKGTLKVEVLGEGEDLFYTKKVIFRVTFIC